MQIYSLQVKLISNVKTQFDKSEYVYICIRQLHIHSLVQSASLQH